MCLPQQTFDFEGFSLKSPFSFKNRYNEDVKRIVENAHEKIDHSSWMILKNKTNARDTAVQAAETAASDARKAIGE